MSCSTVEFRKLQRRAAKLGVPEDVSAGITPRILLAMVEGGEAEAAKMRGD